jgi:hypothetical protein
MITRLSTESLKGFVISTKALKRRPLDIPAARYPGQGPGWGSGSFYPWPDSAKPRGRRAAGGGEPESVAASIPTDIERLERVLLRRGVTVLAADRNRCADCGRTPLVGEQVHLYERHGELVCELCRPLRCEPAVAVETVRHAERGQTCALTARAAREVF